MGHGLPENVDDADLNRQQIADALGVSVVTIDRWQKTGMPVVQEGTNGQAYVFRLSDCWRWKAESDASASEADAKAEASVGQMRLALLGGEEDQTGRELSPSDRKQLLEAEHYWTKMAQARGELIKTEDMVEFLDDLFSLIRDGLGALPDRLARECNLEGQQIERAITACDDTLTETRNKIAERFVIGGEGGGPPLN